MPPPGHPARCLRRRGGPAITSLTKKLSGIAVVVAAAGVLIGFYVTGYLMSGPKAFHPTVVAGPTKSVDLAIETVAAIGPKLSSKPDWVSYLVRDRKRA